MASQYDLPYTGNQVETLLGKVSELEAAMPEKVSDLQNDAGYITEADIPTDVSDFNNDAGYITNAPVTTETQRAQQAEGALAGRLDAVEGKIPSGATTSNKLVTDADIANFITKSVNDLANYYLKSETYTKTEVNGLIGAINQFHYEIYASISSITSPASNVLYLIGPIGSGSDKYEEYVYSGGNFVMIGNTSIDLSGYVTTTALNTTLANYTTTTVLTTLLAGKVDKVNGKGLSTNDFTTEDKTKLSGIASGAQVNVIETVKVNGTALTPSSKEVNIDISGKADKDTDAVEGNIAEFDASGNPVDSGIAASYVSQLGQKVDKKFDRELNTDKLCIIDSNDYVIAEIDVNGVSAYDVRVKIDGNLVSVKSLLATLNEGLAAEKLRAETEEAKKLEKVIDDDALVIMDENGYIIARIDASGIHSAQDKHSVACMVLSEAYYPTSAPTRDASGNITHAVVKYATGVDGSLDITYTNGNATQVIAHYGSYTYTITINRDANWNVTTVSVN